MSREYAESRIREALRQSKGHALRTRQLVIAWTYEDAKLLHALARPHLTGIVAYAVSRVVDRQTVVDEPPAPVPKKQARPAADGSGDQFGRDLLKAIARGEPAMFGQESFGPPMRSRKASQQHIDALKLMAEKSRSKNS